MMITKALLEQIRRNRFESASFINKNIHRMISSADLLCFNFEGAISSKISPRVKILPSYFNFGASPEFIRFIRSLHSDPVISLANNHSLDFDFDGLVEMMDLFTKSGIRYMGAGKTKEEAIQPVIRSVGSLQFAILAYTDLLPSQYYAQPSHPGVTALAPRNLSDGIALARSQADIIIVSLHTIGNILAPFSFLPDTRQVYYSRLAVDCGADIVFGHQPSGLQHFAKYRNGLIFYSLGAFLYDPAIGKYFPKGHVFYDGTQVFGGALAEVKICNHGFYTFELVPTKIISGKNDILYLTHDTQWTSMLKLANWMSNLMLEKFPQKFWDSTYFRKLFSP